MAIKTTHIQTRRGPLLRAGLVLGIGFGGFFDGIVFHQLLQWHHMLSSEITPDTLNGLEINTLADGLFHSATYIVSAIGLWLLFRALRALDTERSPRLFLGAICSGFGLFNFVEGLVDHQILGIHHVRPGPNYLIYDLAFLASGVLLIGIGVLLTRRSGEAS